MSKIAKKIQRKAERRAARKLPTSGSDSPQPTEGAEIVTESELDDQGNPVGTVYNEDGSVESFPNEPPIIEPLP